MLSRLDELRAGIDPLTPLYVLVDPMVGEPLPGVGEIGAGSDPRSRREEAWGRPIVPVALAPSVPLPPHQHPYLVGLHGPDDPLLAATLEIADEERLEAQADGLGGSGRAPHRVGGWLQSGMRDAELAAVLSSMCRVNTVVRTQATYLRVADRRVLDLLCHVCGNARVGGQFGRLQSWSYLDPLGRLRRIRSSVETCERLHLDRTEWQRLERGDMLHRTIAQYLGEKDGVSEAAADELYRLAEEAVLAAAEAARHWPRRFTNSRDETVWAALAMLYPAIPRLPEVHALLDAPTPEDEPPEPLRYLYPELLELVRHD